MNSRPHEHYYTTYYTTSIELAISVTKCLRCINETRGKVSIRSYFLDFGSSYVGIVFFYHVLGHLHEISLAFVILRQTMTIAVRTFAALTSKT